MTQFTSTFIVAVTGRKKLIFAGISLEVCAALPDSDFVKELDRTTHGQNQIPSFKFVERKAGGCRDLSCIG